MDENFIRKRITELRMKKNVSEYRMSTDLGRSKSYVQGITSGRSLPSLSEFLYMCEYLGITPRDFFDDELKNPALLQESIDTLKKLDEEDMILILNNMKRLQKQCIILH
ncbi:MAG: helix-turn-helix domain-containing protein [Defluviitaleaceae bacterium]|nr:helix-turn-helix domain-containing protein [Defluviitaleaceae bacterium]